MESLAKMESLVKMERKRHRAQNFSSAEKQLLLSIVDKYKDIVEDKRTKSHVWREKEITWQKIVDEYNTKTPEVLRELASLKKCYENYKKVVRKSYVKDEYSMISTSDLPVETQLTTPENAAPPKLSLKNLAELTSHLQNENICNAQISNDLATSTNFTNPSIQLFNELNNICGNDIDNQSEISVTPIIDQEQDDVENRKHEQNARLWQKRRRPMFHQTKFSNPYSSIYSELAREKLNLVKLQASILRQDTITRREREREGHIVLQQILLTELKIKQALLMKLQHQDHFML